MEDRLRTAATTVLDEDNINSDNAGKIMTTDIRHGHNDLLSTKTATTTTTTTTTTAVLDLSTWDNDIKG
jgi:hypothetical protein